MRKENGITLIALVVTIVVLLILAGVSISMLLGENGIITQASEAKKASIRGEEQEYVDLANNTAIQNSYLIRGNGVFTQEELKKELAQVSENREVVVKPNGNKYLITFVESKNEFEIDRPIGSLTQEDWDTILEEAKDDETIQGIGTDGTPVDMSLWQYTEIEGGVGLFGGTEEKCSWSENGYLGDCPNGNIIGFVPQYIKVNGEFQPVVSMESTFKGNDELINLPEIPSTVTNIDSICHNCDNLKIATIPSTVGNVGMYAFYGCNNLENVTIANGIKNIEEKAFQSCDKLVKIQLPTSLENIGEDAFSYCTSLSEINLPEGLKSLYESFIGCTSLTSIEIPTTLKSVKSDKYIYYYSASGIAPFKGCTNLKNVKFREGTKETANFLFKDTEIENIEIPDGVKEIGNGTFAGCDNITNVVIPDGVETLGEEAFMWCYNLESIVIPKSVTTIGDSAVYNGHYTMTIYYKGSQEEWKKIEKDGSDNFSRYNIVYNYEPENNNQ